MKKILLTILLLFTLTACSTEDIIHELYEEEIVEIEEEIPVKFTLAYYGSESLNPLTGVSKLNHTIDELLYEGLFYLDNNFQPQPLLCESYSYSDNVYTLVLRSGVYFHSGKFLTADDVIYSYNLAWDNVYASRFENVSKIEKINDYTLTITLKSPNDKFLSLLDIPIIEENSGDMAFPYGTGPYQSVVTESDVYLKDFALWNGDNSNMLYSVIYLENLIDIDTRSYSFEIGNISLLDAQRISSTPLTVSGNILNSQVPTSSLFYLGVNFDNEILQNASVRQAISAIISRSDLCSVNLQSYANEAILPIYPQPQDYDLLYVSNYEASYDYLKLAGIEDYDNDYIMDYMEKNKVQNFTLRFIANDDNAYKESVANSITDSLNKLGISTELVLMDFEDYVVELENGNFDLYLAETYMSNDFDFMPFLEELNYGNIEVETLVDNYNLAKESGDYTAFYDDFLQTMPIIPIAFKMDQIVLRSEISNTFTPLPFNYFYNIEYWRK